MIAWTFVIIHNFWNQQGWDGIVKHILLVCKNRRRKGILQDLLLVTMNISTHSASLLFWSTNTISFRICVSPQSPTSLSFIFLLFLTLFCFHHLFPFSTSLNLVCSFKWLHCCCWHYHGQNPAVFELHEVPEIWQNTPPLLILRKFRLRACSFLTVPCS